MSETQNFIELALKNGIAVVLCFVMVAFCMGIVKWVFTFMDKLLMETLANIRKETIDLRQSTEAAHQTHLLMCESISRNQKDGFDRMLDANKYQREEHKEIISRMIEDEKSSILAREKILNAISEIECNAK